MKHKTEQRQRFYEGEPPTYQDRVDMTNGLSTRSCKLIRRNRDQAVGCLGGCLAFLIIGFVAGAVGLSGSPMVAVVALTAGGVVVVIGWTSKRRYTCDRCGAETTQTAELCGRCGATFIEKRQHGNHDRL